MYTTATPVVKEVQLDGRVRVVVIFSGDDVDPVEQDIFVDSTLDAFKGRLRAAVAQLNVIADATQAIETKKVADLTPPPPPPPPTPTQDELDRAAFTTAVLAYRRATKALEFGVGDQKAVDGAKAIMIAAFKPGYEDLLVAM